MSSNCLCAVVQSTALPPPLRPRRQRYKPSDLGTTELDKANSSVCGQCAGAGPACRLNVTLPCRLCNVRWTLACTSPLNSNTDNYSKSRTGKGRRYKNIKRGKGNAARLRLGAGEKAQYHALILDQSVSNCIPPRHMNFLNLDRIHAPGRKGGEKTQLYPGMFSRVTKVVR